MQRLLRLPSRYAIQRRTNRAAAIHPFAYNIKTEKAQIDSVWDELAKPMLAGLKDYDSNIDELRSALKAAGWDTYVAEIRKQYDEFLANK